MSAKKVKVQVIYHNRAHKWSWKSDTQFEYDVLKQFAKDKHKIKEQIKLEYIRNKDNNERVEIKNDNDLQNALQVIQDEKRKKLQIYVETLIYIDFTIFESISSNCDGDYICRCTRRIVTAMKYYQTLDIHNIETDRNKLEEFYDKTYKHILDDFTHVISHHPKTLDEMYDFAVQNRNLQKCDVKNCPRLSRHNREREPSDKIEEFKTE
eukprot:77364_1